LNEVKLAVEKNPDGFFEFREVEDLEEDKNCTAVLRFPKNPHSGFEEKKIYEVNLRLAGGSKSYCSSQLRGEIHGCGPSAI
jgi:hypothetical protein